MFFELISNDVCMRSTIDNLKFVTSNNDESHGSCCPLCGPHQFVVQIPQVKDVEEVVCSYCPLCPISPANFPRGNLHLASRRPQACVHLDTLYIHVVHKRLDP